MINTYTLNGISFNADAYYHLRNLLSTVISADHPCYDASDDIYDPWGHRNGHDEYNNYIGRPIDVYHREEWFMRRAIGEGNERNVPGAGMALALAGCFGKVESPAELFPYLSQLSTMSDIANSPEALAEILISKNLFRLCCMSEYLKGYLNLGIVENNINTGSSYTGSVLVYTTIDKPFIYIWLNGYEPTTNRRSKVNLISNGVTRNIWTSSMASGSSRDSAALTLSKHLVIDPVADYSMGRNVTVQFVDITGNGPVYTAS